MELKLYRKLKHAICCINDEINALKASSCPCCVIQYEIPLTGTSQTIDNAAHGIREIHNVIVRDSNGVISNIIEIAINGTDVEVSTDGINMTGLTAYISGCEGVVVAPPVTYNFDVTADWSLVGSTPVTNQATFEDWLTIDLGATSVVVNAFDLTAGKLQADIVVQGVVALDLFNKNVSECNKISGFDAALTDIDLSNNSILSFNPAIALPSSTTYLGLGANPITIFNPSIALPNGLLTLDISLNNLVTFNPSLTLPLSITQINLIDNQMTTAGYTTSETWANAQPAFTTNCDVVFTNNTNSVSGTNLETILISKGCTVIPW